VADQRREVVEKDCQEHKLNTKDAISQCVEEVAKGWLIIRMGVRL